MSSKFHLSDPALASKLPEFVKTLTARLVKQTDTGNQEDYDKHVANALLRRIETTFGAKHCKALFPCLYEIYKLWMKSDPPIRHVMDVSQRISNALRLITKHNTRSRRVSEFNVVLSKRYPDMRHQYFAVAKTKEASKAITAKRKADYKEKRDQKLSNRVELNASAVKDLIELCWNKIDGVDYETLGERKRSEIHKYTSAYVMIAVGLRPVECVLPDLTQLKVTGKMKVEIKGFAKMKKSGKAERDERVVTRPILPGATAERVVRAHVALQRYFAEFNQKTGKPVITYAAANYTDAVGTFFRKLTRLLQSSKLTPIEHVREKYKLLGRTQFSTYVLRHLYMTSAFGIYKPSRNALITAYLPTIGGWSEGSADVVSLSYSSLVVHNNLISKGHPMHVKAPPPSKKERDHGILKEIKSKLALHEKLLYTTKKQPTKKRLRDHDKENQEPEVKARVKRTRIRRPPVVNVAILSQARKDKADTIELVDGRVFKGIDRIWSAPTAERAVREAIDVLQKMTKKVSKNQIKALVGGNASNMGRLIDEVMKGE